MFCVYYCADDSCDIKQEPGIESAPLPSKKKILKSQKNKAVKKPSKVKSRPANRVVTKNGKVVGKTTKGMKKTGVPTIPDAIQQSFPSSQLHETPTEPVRDDFLILIFVINTQIFSCQFIDAQ